MGSSRCRSRWWRRERGREVGGGMRRTRVRERRAGRALALPALLVACSTLPDHARPRAEVMDPAVYRPGDAIRYRALTRADFRADEPPRQVAAHAAFFG